MFIYVIVCSETLKIYIGQHKGRDLPQYLRSKWYAAHHRLSDRSRLYAAMRKHPKESWSIHPLLLLQTRTECDYYEQKLVKALKTQHLDVGYNICRGGEGFTGPHTPEALHKMDEKRKAYWRNPEAHRLRRESSKKMWADSEMKEKISKAIKDAPNATRFLAGSVPWNVGTKGIMKPNSGSFGLGRGRPLNSGPKGPNSGSFQKGHHLNQGRVFSKAHRDALSRAHMKNKTL